MKPTTGQCGCGNTLWGNRDLCQSCYNRRPAPEGFAADRDLSYNILRGKYHASTKTILRWKREHGAIIRTKEPKWTHVEDAYLRSHARQPVDGQARDLGRTVSAVVSRRRVLGIAKASNSLANLRPWNNGPSVKPTGDSSPAARAAQHVAIHDGTPVYRIDERGKPNPKGDRWRYGHAHGVRTDDEIMAMAKRKGFDPDAWKRLAA